MLTQKMRKLFQKRSCLRRPVTCVVRSVRCLSNSSTKRRSQRGRISLWRISKYRLCSSEYSTNHAFQKKIQKHAVEPLHKVSFREMIQFGEMQYNARTPEDNSKILVQSAEFVRQQLIGRVARVIVHLQSLPYGVAQSPSVLRILDDYYITYDMTANGEEIRTIEQEREFTDKIRARMKSHLVTAPLLCAGILETNESNPAISIAESPYLNDFIDKVMKERITARVMIAQHLSMHKGMGSVFKRIDLRLVVEAAVNDASKVCELYFGYAPAVHLHCYRRRKEHGASEYVAKIAGLPSGDIGGTPSSSSSSHLGSSLSQTSSSTILSKGSTQSSVVCGGDIEDIASLSDHSKPLKETSRRSKSGEFTYVPQHVRHMCYELLKNAMRASCEADSAQPLSTENVRGMLDNDLVSDTDGRRAIHVVIVEGEDEAAIKIQDIGLGVPRELLDTVWMYSYSTGVDSEGRSRSELLKSVTQMVIDSDRAPTLGALTQVPMFGLGYGLPMCRLYSQYYSGDCQLHSVHGYGSDAVLFLTNLRNSDDLVVG